MKHLSITIILLTSIFVVNASGQSNPIALKAGITINRILTVQNGSIRVIKDPVSRNLFYSTTDGKIFEVHQPSGSAAYDSLVFTSADHMVTYAQGFTVHDSTFYISGNDSSNKPLTFGIIVRGVLQPNGTRMWSKVMQTDFYETGDYFDHLFSGLAVTPSGDSLLICSGARGDHGEIETRYGLYPNLRNVPLTTNLYIVPANDTGIVVLHNDSVWNDTSDLLYARGIRNTFDLAFDGGGHLFGVENSGDRDHNEEMNWLRRGRHYGFPWVMGDTDNPQQFPGFIPAADPLISHYSRSWRIGAWSNDPTFPPPPTGVVFDAPIQNFGPDADKYRDPVTGLVMDASDSSVSIGTFTAHRSPLGLVFDNDSVMHTDYRGDGFMLSWTKGLDSCGCTAIPDSGIGPFVDPSQDLIHLDLAFDSLIDNFTLHATRVIAEFQHPVDDAIDSNKIYVLENGYGGTSGLYEVVMPFIPVCAPAYSAAVTHYACDSAKVFATANATGFPPYIYVWRDSTGQTIQTDTLNSDDSLSIFMPGNYSVEVIDSFGCNMLIPFTIIDPVQFNINLFNLCDSGLAFSVANADGTGPFSYTWRSPDSTGTIIQYHSPSPETDSLFNIPPGNYFVVVSDSIGCSVSTSFTIVAPIVLHRDSVHHTTCIGCNNGSIFFSVAPGPFSLVLNPPVGFFQGNSIDSLPPGGYTLCGTDSMGCSSCINFIIQEDPSSIAPIAYHTLSIFPNPADGIITIRTKINTESPLSINIFNATGQKTGIVADELISAASEREFSLDTKNLSPGCYYVEFRLSTQVMRGKFIVTKN